MCFQPALKSLFVDDFSITCYFRNMASIERQLQLCLNKVEKWADENGFKFSKTKTVCMHFCNKRKLHLEHLLFHKLSSLVLYLTVN